MKPRHFYSCENMMPEILHRTRACYVYPTVLEGEDSDQASSTSELTRPNLSPQDLLRHAQQDTSIELMPTRAHCPGNCVLWGSVCSATGSPYRSYFTYCTDSGCCWTVCRLSTPLPEAIRRHHTRLIDRYSTGTISIVTCPSRGVSCPIPIREFT